MKSSTSIENDRRRVAGHRACAVWLTGLSGSGKTTLARALERELLARNRLACVLDGDAIRSGLNADLGFTPADRRENIRRAAHVARLLVDAGLLTVTAFISPYRAARAEARRIIGRDRFIEVHLDVPVAVCERRDPKGLYRRARAGAVRRFTGVTAPFEPPRRPDIRLDTAARTVGACVDDILRHLRARGFLDAGRARRPTRRRSNPPGLA